MIPQRQNNGKGEGEGLMSTTLRGDSNSNHRSPQASISKATSSNSDSNSNGRVSSKHNHRKLCRTLLLMGFLVGGLGLAWNENHVVMYKTNNYKTAPEEEFPKKKNFRYNRNPNNASSGTSVLGSSVNEFSPGIAWLMSFPNSGTSYTLQMVSVSSNRSFATNYGQEGIYKDDASPVRIYPSYEGPYWPGLSGNKPKARELPDTFVITKTHCGLYCGNCGPNSYITSAKKFLQMCASEKKIEFYPTNWVQRAIHLYRNPMHNIISRYHNLRKSDRLTNKTDWLAAHENNAAGLHLWCAELGQRFQPQDSQFFGGDSFIPKAPCHGEFYRWTQWHNFAHQSIQMMREGGPERSPRREVPLLKIYYEDFNTRFDDTAGSILQFLELDQVAPFPEFKFRSDYGEYFSRSEVINIKTLVKSVATEETWKDVRHYFDGVPDDIANVVDGG